LFYIQTHGGAAYGFPDNPTGLYRVNAAAHTVTLIANIGAYNIANPVPDISSGRQQDIETGGNPYSMIVRDGAFYVVDGNQNQIMKITPDGDISRITDFPGHPVTTGIAFNGGGPFYVGALGQFPFAAESGLVYSVGFPTGNETQIASGVSSITSVGFSAAGQLYALNFGDQATSPDGPPWQLFTGKVLKVNGDGTMSPVVTGFNLATSMLFVGDTLYVVNHGISLLAPGEVWAVENFSSLAPLPVEPTAAPDTSKAPTPAPTRTGIVAPNTGTGSASDNGGSGWLLIVLAMAAVGVATVGGALAVKRG
jgi:hypothetical protein